MGQITLGEQASPTTPASGVIIYPTVATPSIPMIKDDSGNDWEIARIQNAGTAWTPGISFGGGTTGIAYAADGQVGRYHRFGNVIVAQAFIELSNKGSSTGAAVITGLPVASKNITNFFQACIARYNGITGITGMVQAHINPNTQTVALSYLGTGTATGMDNTHFTNSSNIMITAIYQV